MAKQTRTLFEEVYDVMGSTKKDWIDRTKEYYSAISTSEYVKSLKKLFNRSGYLRVYINTNELMKANPSFFSSSSF